MPAKLLHALNVPENAQTEARGQRRRRTAKQGQLSAGPGAARAISTEPGEQVLTGYYAGKFADVQAREIEELFEASGVGEVPFAARDTQDNEDGYYVLENVGTRRPDPRVQKTARFDGTLTRKGTRSTHWRSVRANVQTETNPFGSASTPEFGIDARATKVRWFDREGGGIESATVQRTNEGEHGPIDIYDASEPTFDTPDLIHDIDYTQEWQADCRVWDTYGRTPKEFQVTSSSSGAVVGTDTVGSATVGSSVDATVASQWQRVYVTDHEWRGETVIENDVLQLWVDRPESRLRAYRWDDRDEIYASVSLGASADRWRIFDVNIKRIGLSRIEAQFEFEDKNGNTQNVDMHLYRGLKNAHWFQTTNGSAIPSTLQTQLDPIADDSDDIAVAESTIVEREDTDQ